MKKAQYIKYKEVYRVDLDIIKKTIKNCDVEINKEIESKNSVYSKFNIAGDFIQFPYDNEDEIFKIK